MVIESCRQENEGIAKYLEYSLIRDNTLSFKEAIKEYNN